MQSECLKSSCTIKMPKTGAERNKNYRQKIKANPQAYATYKEKERQRKKASRNKNITRRKAEIERKKVKERDRLCRLKKKLANKALFSAECESTQPIECIYKTPQALGKAVKKVSKQLPSSPRKRKAVISKIAEATGLTVDVKLKDPCSNSRIPDSTVEEVQKFYTRDSISCVSPGRKDFVLSRENGKKSKLQKRHLIWSLKETYAMFLQEYPHIKIGSSRFCELRPVNVLLKSSTPREICLCQYHDNIKMLCDTLNKEIENFPSFSYSFVDNFVCNSNNEECMMGKCQECPNWFATIKEEEDLNLDEIVEWSQWERVTQTVKTKSGKAEPIKKMMRIMKNGTVEESLEALESKMPIFLEHEFVRRKQSSYFEDRVTHLESNEAVVQVDFAENYACKYQDEIQSAHWRQEQVTLFTVAIWAKNSDGVTTCNTHVIVSDEHNHEKESVAVFMDKVVNGFLRDDFPNVKKVDIFSDGPSSQFKNRFMANFYSILQRRGLIVRWHFFATSHGKGVVDGVGGTVKRVVYGAVLTRKVPTVSNAKEFAEAAAKFCK